MIKTSDYGEWFIFYNDLDEELQAHFDAGGTVEMLDGIHPLKSSSHMALYNCANQHAERCLSILMKHGAKPNNDIWNLVFCLNRTKWVELFLKYVFWPTRENVSFEKSYFYCKEEVTFVLCKKTTLHVLCIAKFANQPMRDIWKIVARFIHSTKYEEVWLDLLLYYSSNN